MASKQEKKELLWNEINLLESTASLSGFLGLKKNVCEPKLSYPTWQKYHATLEKQKEHRVKIDILIDELMREDY